jgi:hypothetical protein
MIDMTIRGLTAGQAAKIAALLKRMQKKDGGVVALDGDDPPDDQGPGGPK